MTNKHANARTHETAPKPAHETLRIAYEIHTLVQMVYAQLAARPLAPAAIPTMLHGTH